MAYSRTDATAFVIDPERPGQVVTELPAFEGKGEWFAASSWSRDGGKLAGFISLPAASAGIAIYDFGAGKFTRYAAAAGYQPQFLPDGRVVYTVNSEIMLLDPKSGKSSRIADVKPFALGPKLAVSPDGRKIYASLAPTESDIWMVEFDAKK